MAVTEFPSLLASLRVKIFADGADLEGMTRLYAHPAIAGFTTNPTLMRKAGITDYRAFARQVLTAIPDRPISFEVFSDESEEMIRQGREISTWGGQVNVKIPITNSRGESTESVVRALAARGVRLNITALMTNHQVRQAASWLSGSAPSYISLFAGRIADTGRDPVPMVRQAVADLAAQPQLSLIWASPRELLNIFHADAAGCHVITVTHDMLNKLSLLDYDLDAYSLDTVRMFRNDAVAAGFTL